MKILINNNGLNPWCTDVHTFLLFVKLLLWSLYYTITDTPTVLRGFHLRVRKSG